MEDNLKKMEDDKLKEALCQKNGAFDPAAAV